MQLWFIAPYEIIFGQIVYFSNYTSQTTSGKYRRVVLLNWLKNRFAIGKYFQSHRRLLLAHLANWRHIPIAIHIEVTEIDWVEIMATVFEWPWNASVWNSTITAQESNKVTSPFRRMACNLQGKRSATKRERDCYDPARLDRTWSLLMWQLRAFPSSNRVIQRLGWTCMAFGSYVRETYTSLQSTYHDTSHFYSEQFRKSRSASSCRWTVSVYADLVGSWNLWQNV